MMEPTYLERHPKLKDTISFGVFIICVLIGTLLINSFIFRTFSVSGPSMEQTFYTGDRLIVNLVPVTMAKLQNKTYTPEREQVIVFKNPNYVTGNDDMYLVKRVIAFGGERVVVKDGSITVYNDEHPEGFNPDKDVKGPGAPTSGDIDTVVPEGSIFVSGDHRDGQHSLDSRNGLGTVPLFDVIGPVKIRIWPITGIGFY